MKNFSFICSPFSNKLLSQLEPYFAIVAVMILISSLPVLGYGSNRSSLEKIFSVQQHQIQGAVTDENGTPLVGVTVKVKGTSQGTVTDAQGNFILVVPDSATLEVSYIGYETQEVEVGDQTNFTIQLEATARGLNEIVVVGYGTQKKANLTGAVDQVGDEVFENRPMPNVTQGLQGVIPNLNITLADGKPTRSANYQVRGIGSIGQGGSALVLIDGVEGDPSLLNPDDIASVTVLKDAASAAIYGARGAFGVVLITTKDPQKGKTSITYSGNFSIKSATVIPDMVTDPVLYSKMFVDAYSAYYDYARTPTGFHHSLPYSHAWFEKLENRPPGAPVVEVGDDGTYEYFGHTDFWRLNLFKLSNK